MGYEEIWNANPCQGCPDQDGDNGCKSNGGCLKPENNSNCLNCLNSFSEPAEDENEPDILHYMEKDGKIVEENSWCELHS